jgi:4-hydroxybenzoate polyprenyltransferase
MKSCVSASLVFVIGAFSRIGHVSFTDTALGATAVCLAVAQANVLNDIVDQRLDAIDQPWRPIACGSISPRSAWVSYIVCCLAALCIGWLVTPMLSLWLIVLVTLSAGYSLWLKSTVLLGNIVIALMATSPLLIGAKLALGLNGELLMKGAVVCVSMASFEVIKTARDIRGDAKGGLRTVATCWGVDRSVRLGMQLCLLSALAAVGASVVSLRGLLFCVVFVVFVVFPIARFYYKDMSGSSTFVASDAMRLFHVMCKAWKFVFLALAVSIVGVG